MKESTKKKIKTLTWFILFPIITYLVFGLVVYIKTGRIFLGNTLSFNSFVRTISLMGLLALATSLQIPNGRFDFSIGSIMILSIIIASNIGSNLGLSSFVTLLLFMLCGIVFGAISGLVYVLLRIKAMVTSIGVMMVYEAISGILFNGKGFSDFKALTTIYSLVNNLYTCMLLLLFAFILSYILKKFTKFGYNIRSIKGGQKIAVEAGINEKWNAIACYTLAGLFTGMAGMVYAFQCGGVVEAQSGMSTIGLMFQGFLAMMIGEFLERWDDISLGVFIGAFVASLFTSFLTALGMDIDTITLINAFLLLAILLSNKYFDNIAGFVKKLFKSGKKEENKQI